MQYLDRLKHLGAAVIHCCITDLYKQPKGLDDPEAFGKGDCVCRLFCYIFSHN